MKRFLIASLAITTLGIGCGSDEPTDDFPETLSVDGKGDIANGVTRKGELSFGSEVNGEFARDFETHAYSISANASSELRVEVTNAGSTRALDPVMYLYAPTDEGYVRIAKDDESGYGTHPRIDITLRKKGDFLLVLKPERDDARGKYRITLECTGDNCVPEPEPIEAYCPMTVIEAMYDCSIEVLPYDSEPDEDLLYEECGMSEALWYHELVCQLGDHEFCDQDYESFFVEKVMPECLVDGLDEYLGQL